MFLFQVLIPATPASGEIHAGLLRFTRADQEFINCVSSADPQLPVKMDPDTEDVPDNRPLPPTYVFRTFRTFRAVLAA